MEQLSSLGGSFTFQRVGNSQMSRRFSHQVVEMLYQIIVIIIIIIIIMIMIKMIMSIIIIIIIAKIIKFRKKT